MKNTTEHGFFRLSVRRLCGLLNSRTIVPLLGIICLLSQVGRAGAAQPRIWINHDEPLPPPVEAYFDTYGAANSIIIYQPVFDPDNNAVFCPTALTTWLTNNVPEGWNRPLVPDWEGKWGTILYLGVGAYHSSTGTITQQMYDDAIEQGVELLELITTECPDALVGFYGIPYLDSQGNMAAAWHRINDPLGDIYDASTALFPSFYDWYPNGNFDPYPSERNQLDDLEANLVEALELAESEELPLFAYIWYRWHGSGDDEVAYHLIDEADFQSHIQKIFDVHTAGDTYVNGVVWWGADRYFHELSITPEVNPDWDQATIFAWVCCRDGFPEEMPLHPYSPSHTYPDDYMDWDFYFNSLMLGRLIMLSNIAYDSDLPLAVMVQDVGLPADVTLSSGSTSTNLDTQSLKVGVNSNDYNFRAILDFGNLESSGAEEGSIIAFANLTLFVDDGNAAENGYAFSFHPMSELDWIEGEATWNNATSGSSWTTAGGDFVLNHGVTTGYTLPTTEGFQSYDILPTIQFLFSEAAGECDLMIKRNAEAPIAAEDFAIFDDAEGTAEPWLVLTFIPPAQ